jgi:hypothetical protein
MEATLVEWKLNQVRSSRQSLQLSIHPTNPTQPNQDRLPQVMNSATTPVLTSNSTHTTMDVETPLIHPVVTPSPIVQAHSNHPEHYNNMPPPKRPSTMTNPPEADTHRGIVNPYVRPASTHENYVPLNPRTGSPIPFPAAQTGSQPLLDKNMDIDQSPAPSPNPAIFPNPDDFFGEAVFPAPQSSPWIGSTPHDTRGVLPVQLLKHPLKF